MARVPSMRLVFRTGAWGPIAAMVITFLSALFIPLQYTIFLGAALSLILYVVASSRKFRLQQAVRLADGGWEVHEAPKELAASQATVMVVQGLDFFAEVPTLDDQMPPARGVSNAVVILVLRDMQTLSSTGIKWLERYAKELTANDSLLILADVNPAVVDVLKKSGVAAVIGEQNIFPASPRILEAENVAWEAGQRWLQQRAAAGPGIESRSAEV